MNKEKKVDIACILVAVFLITLIGCVSQIERPNDDWSKLQGKNLPELQRLCFTWNKDWFDRPLSPYCKVGGIYYYDKFSPNARGMVLEMIEEEENATDN